MLLSQLLQKTIYTGETLRGITLSVGFSMKTHTIKQLLCSTKISENPTLLRPDFAVNVSAISAVADKISLVRLRPVLPNSPAKLSLHLPVYTHDGAFLGNLADGEIENFVLVRLTTERNYTFTPNEIAVCNDAVFIRKQQPYPLGQRVPSPILSTLQSNEKTVTKPLLRKALNKGTLIKLTLSLPPFSLAQPLRID